jgi:O-methyltransferase involved in polyketide biosynthesis
MTEKRIDTATSRTAEMTCLARAISSLDTNPRLRCDDRLAVRLLPSAFRAAVHLRPFRCSLHRPRYEAVAEPGYLGTSSSVADRASGARIGLTMLDA